jgi:hypothetical protein
MDEDLPIDDIILYIELQKEIPGFPMLIPLGAAIHDELEDHALAAERLGVRPLCEFFSMNPEEGEAVLAEEGIEIGLPPEEWFTAKEALDTLSVLLTAGQEDESVSSAREDLVGMQQILQEVEKYQVLWHLTIGCPEE